MKNVCHGICIISASQAGGWKQEAVTAAARASVQSKED